MTSFSGRMTLIVLLLIAVSGGVGQSQQRKTTPSGGDPLTEVTYAQVYATADGETHFREVRVPLVQTQLAPPAAPYAHSSAQPASTIRHAVFPAHWGASERDRNVFHNASERRFISIRRGVAWIKASDGEIRQFQPGDIVEVLDVAPSKGHITWVGDEPSVLLFSNHP